MKIIGIISVLLMTAPSSWGCPSINGKFQCVADQNKFELNIVSNQNELSINGSALVPDGSWRQTESVILVGYRDPVTDVDYRGSCTGNSINVLVNGKLRNSDGKMIANANAVMKVTQLRPSALRFNTTTNVKPLDGRPFSSHKAEVNCTLN